MDMHTCFFASSTKFQNGLISLFNGSKSARFELCLKPVIFIQKTRIRLKVRQRVSQSMQLVQSLIARAKENFEEVNGTHDKPYRLSASMGYAIADLHTETIADFMNRIDRQMYQDKLGYYAKNDRRKGQPAAADNDAGQ